MPGAEVHLLWKILDAVHSDKGLSLLPTARFADCSRLDVICVPGGPGQVDLMDDEVTLEFIRRIAENCRLITSVCTGSLVLGAAGLLTGYRATCHWNSIDQLEWFGAKAVHERVVCDRNRITGAGVTSGIDLALTIAGDLLGHSVAEEISLQMEYDPEPPYRTGSPRIAPAELVETVQNRIADFMERRRLASERASRRLDRKQ